MDFRKTSIDIFHNGKIKLYPDGQSEVSICSKPVYKESGYEVEYSENKNSGKKYNTENPRENNIRRAKNKVYDISKLNKFKYFVTLTINKELLDRYNKIEVKKKIIKLLNNLTERRKGFNYLLIPEYHKDGAIHMHMLCTGENLKIEKTDYRDKSGRVIYKFLEWKYGFSECVEIDDNTEFVSGYITKYISKESNKIFGKFYYSGGKTLKKEVPYALFDTDYNSYTEKEYRIEEAGISFKYPKEIIT